MRRWFGLPVLALLLAAPVAAHPGAAPWEVDGRPGRDSCASCHFDAEPVREGDALRLGGLPDKVEPQRVYDLTITLEHDEMKVAGFLLAATAGGFESGDGVETRDMLARSTLEKAKQGERAAWTFSWRAPQDLGESVAFYLSANAGNDDQSAFGDTIYLDVVKAGN